MSERQARRKYKFERVQTNCCQVKVRLSALRLLTCQAVLCEGYGGSRSNDSDILPLGPIDFHIRMGGTFPKDYQVQADSHVHKVLLLSGTLIVEQIVQKPEFDAAQSEGWHRGKEINQGS